MEGLISKYGAPLGITCAPLASLAGLEPLLSGCYTPRSADSIQQAVSSLRAQLVAEDDAAGPSAAGSTQQQQGSTQQQQGSTQQQQGSTQQQQGEDSDEGSAQEMEVDGAASRAAAPGAAAAAATATAAAATAAAAAAAAASSAAAAAAASGPEGAGASAGQAASPGSGPEPPGMMVQLQDALMLWEELKSNARTPSTVLRAAPAPPAAEAGSAAGQ